MWRLCSRFDIWCVKRTSVKSPSTQEIPWKIVWKKRISIYELCFRIGLVFGKVFGFNPGAKIYPLALLRACASLKSHVRSQMELKWHLMLRSPRTFHSLDSVFRSTYKHLQIGVQPVCLTSQAWFATACPQGTKSFESHYQANWGTFGILKIAAQKSNYDLNTKLWPRYNIHSKSTLRGAIGCWAFLKVYHFYTEMQRGNTVKSFFFSSQNSVSVLTNVCILFKMNLLLEAICNFTCL